MTANDGRTAVGLWDESALNELRKVDPAWTEEVVQMSTNPWTSGVLPRKTVELIGLAVSVACTNLNADGARRHIRAAIGAGAMREEILMVLKMASLLLIHTCSLAAPMLLEEAKAAGVQLVPKEAEATPVCDKLKALGQWNAGLGSVLHDRPAVDRGVHRCRAPVYIGSVLSPKLAELLSIAFDASITHMYAPGTRRHIKAALKCGATMDEIMEVLKICVAEGVQACNLGMPILAEELARVGSVNT